MLVEIITPTLPASSSHSSVSSMAGDLGTVSSRTTLNSSGSRTSFSRRKVLYRDALATLSQDHPHDTEAHFFFLLLSTRALPNHYNKSTAGSLTVGPYCIKIGTPPFDNRILTHLAWQHTDIILERKPQLGAHIDYCKFFFKRICTEVETLDRCLAMFIIEPLEGVVKLLETALKTKSHRMPKQALRKAMGVIWRVALEKEIKNKRSDMRATAGQAIVSFNVEDVVQALEYEGLGVIQVLNETYNVLSGTCENVGPSGMADWAYSVDEGLQFWRVLADDALIQAAERSNDGQNRKRKSEDETDEDIRQPKRAKSSVEGPGDGKDGSETFWDSGIGED